MLKGSTQVLGLMWKGLKEKIEKAESGQAVFEQTLESIRIFEEKVNSVRTDKQNADNQNVVKLREYLFMKGISEINIEKIMSGNALRVLKEGWGRRRTEA